MPRYITVYSGMSVAHCMVSVLPDQHMKSLFLSCVSYNGASEYRTMLAYQFLQGHKNVECYLFIPMCICRRAVR